ncbi:MAG: glycosyltransferase [Alphaproteobacteria bacterium]|nr:glycosyltransferase [Alphaproteobacteria bacterium]
MANDALPALIVFWRGDTPVCQHWRENGQISDIDACTATNCTGADNATNAPTSADVSVIICTRDRPAALRRCLASFARQTLPPKTVIVVDNASRTAETREVARAAGAVYVREDRPGLDYARNAGARAAQTEFIAYTDDDTELHPHWLKRLIAGFIRDDIMAVTGLVLPAALDAEAQWIFERHWGFGRGYKPILFDQTYYAKHRKRGVPAWEIGAGANMAFRRSVFERIGGFDPRLDVGAAGCSGDSEYWHRILSAGYACRYEPSAVVFHHHRTEMAALGKQLHAYMRGHTAALLVQFERSREWSNLRRLFLSLPDYYAKRCTNRAVRSRDHENAFLSEEISGAVSGVVFYLTAPKPVKAG